MTQVKIRISQDETLLATFHKEIQTQHHQWYPTIFKPFDQPRFEQAITQQLQEPSHHFYRLVGGTALWLCASSRGPFATKCDDA